MFVRENYSVPLRLVSLYTGESLAMTFKVSSDIDNKIFWIP